METEAEEEAGDADDHTVAAGTPVIADADGGAIIDRATWGAVVIAGRGAGIVTGGRVVVRGRRRPCHIAGGRIVAGAGSVSGRRAVGIVGCLGRG